MRVIAHRGNLTGPDPEKENTWAAVRKCARLDIDAEIDFWVKDNRLCMGHDENNLEQVSLYQFRELKINIYAHCKNLDALQFLGQNTPGNMIPFSHDVDDFVALRNGEIWAHPNYLKNIKDKTMVIAMTWGEPVKEELLGFAGVCTDWPLELL